jgi:non-ribosomal peptide synthetase component F
MGLLAGLNAIFYLYTGQDDIIVGSPVAGRQHRELEGQIGLYLNTLALRTRLRGTDNFRELLRTEKQVLVGAYQHQVYPFDMLIDKLKTGRDISRSPLFDILIILQNQASTNIHAQEIAFDELRMLPLEGMERVTSQFDLEFSFSEAAEELHLLITYNCEVYSENDIERLSGHFERLIEQVGLNPDLPISAIDYLAEEEKSKLLLTFNDTEAAYPKDESLVSLFEKQALSTPDKVAVVYENRLMTYEQLNEKANQVASTLRQRYLVRPGELVAIMMDRSEQMITGILGVLKAGAAYVPVDPGYPKERIAYILSDSKARVIITGAAGTVDADYCGECFRLDNDIIPSVNGAWWQQKVQGQDLCYVIYTSGSTGQPKGVMISHYNVINFFTAMSRALPVSEEDCFLALTSTSFDISVLELLWTLCSGAWKGRTQLSTLACSFSPVIVTVRRINTNYYWKQ